MRPEITVAIYTYNHHQYIADTLDSILAQEGVDLEIVVVPVKSDTRVLQVLEAYQGKVRIVMSDYPSITHQMNLALHAARGEYIELFCSDDIMLPGALLGMLTQAREKNSVITYPLYRVVVNSLKDSRHHSQPHGRIPEWVDEPDLLKTRCFITDVSLIHADTFHEFLPLRWEDRRNRVYRVWLEMSERYPDRIHRWNHDAFLYRQHGKNEHMYSRRKSPEVTAPDTMPEETYTRES